MWKVEKGQWPRKKKAVNQLKMLIGLFHHCLSYYRSSTIVMQTKWYIFLYITFHSHTQKCLFEFQAIYKNLWYSLPFCIHYTDTYQCWYIFFFFFGREFKLKIFWKINFTEPNKKNEQNTKYIQRLACDRVEVVHLVSFIWIWICFLWVHFH